MKRVMSIGLMLMATITFAQTTEKNSVEIEIFNIGSDEGQMYVALYDSEDSWLNTTYMGDIVKIQGGKSRTVFRDMPDGTYAASVFHDEDNDGELNMFLGIPTEDTGSSNNAPANFGPPKWSDAKFEVRGGTIKQSIEL